MNWKKKEFPDGVFYIGDCREVLKTIPSGSVDVVFTDPPYVEKRSLGSVEVLFEIEKELWRVLKPDGWLITWWSVKDLPVLIKGLKAFEYRWMIVVEIVGMIFRSIIGPRTYLPILVYSKGKPKVYHRLGDKIIGKELPVLEDDKIGNSDFKSTIANAYILSMFTEEGDVVLDPFAGFGSIPLVCRLFNRRFIAIEQDQRRAEIALRILETKRVPNIKKLLEEVRE